MLHLEAINADGLIGTDQDNDNGGGTVRTLQSYWFVKSDQLGKVSVGLQSQASDNTAILVDGSGSLISANWVAFDTNNFMMRHNNGALFGNERWGGAQGCAGMGGAWGDCNGATRNVVRYDSPTFAGFSVSASWGEDDMWDVAARYSGEFNGIKVAAAVAYNEVNDEGMISVPGDTNDYFQAGLYIQHVPTGLFVLGNYGILDVESAAEEADTWYVKAGLRTRFNALGHTVFYGEYLNGQDGGTISGFGANSELDVWGLGVVQEVDAAAMSVWLKYRNMSYEDDFHQGPINGIQDFQYVGLGAIINF